MYIFFNFWRGFCVSFALLFPKAPAFCCKKILNKFLLHYTSIFISSKSGSQIFKTLFQTGDINFVLRGVFFRRYFQIKSSFSDEKKQRLNLRQTLVERLSKINVTKYSRKIPSLVEVGALQSHS